MKYGRYGWSYLFLRAGLGAVFLWIGLDMFRHPETWIGYIPAHLPGGMSRDTGLRLAGFFDAALGVLLFTRFMPAMVGLLAAAHLLGIIVVHGIDAVLIRDVGLLGAALAIAAWPQHRYRRRRGWLFWKRRTSGIE
ncbi:MAG: hypothetical protein COU35_00640 [Candidatus Magasanikbacteria bacterium CG10_big_fil_rev_8_21_14_0_10_47_10]|uniref:DoxX family protein n=1 Tax=Candidatus Magasanikbacteria bacterium CG10_big_fil_rev_8_21_14_0_10_47_10 TaxID=1974652 RepID=A0A2H0TRI8_9BACT|nr:MAG: hypothetical protein COU35_00640 [Candidatus Magasanikbacteria bacterium CG10_big_fil_rev_8_21_14_0_10_47_10]